MLMYTKGASKTDALFGRTLLKGNITRPPIFLTMNGD